MFRLKRKKDGVVAWAKSVHANGSIVGWSQNEVDGGQFTAAQLNAVSEYYAKERVRVGKERRGNIGDFEAVEVPQEKPVVVLPVAEPSPVSEPVIEPQPEPKPEPVAAPPVAPAPQHQPRSKKHRGQ